MHRDGETDRGRSPRRRQPPRLVQRRSGGRRGPRARGSNLGKDRGNRRHHRSRDRERGRRTHSPRQRTSRENNKGKQCARDRRDRRERTEDDRVYSRPPSGVSSTRSKIFYSGEFLNKSAEELWPDATLPRKAQTAKRGGRGILKNRTAKAITMDMLRHRNTGRDANGTCLPTKPGLSGEDGKAQKGVRDKPFQRFRPTSTARKGVVPKLKAAPVLREYIENKANTKGDQSRR